MDNLLLLMLFLIDGSLYTGLDPLDGMIAENDDSSSATAMIAEATSKVEVDKKAELTKIILENMRPSVLFDVVVKRLNTLEIKDFFGITTSLSEANILKPTKEVVD